MARLWTSGFELQSVTAGEEFDASNGTGAKSISTSLAHGGSASLRVNCSSDYWFLGHRFRAAATGIVYCRFYLYVGTAPSSDISIFAITDSTSGGNSGAQLKLTTTKTLQLGHYNGSFTNVGSPSAALISNVWYRIEVSYDDADANNTITARLEGVQFATGNGGNLGGNGVIQLGSVFSTASQDINIDDVAVNDATGSFQTSWPGNGKIKHLRPNAAGDNTGLTTGVSDNTNHYLNVDDVTLDGDSTYNQTSTASQTDDYNIEASGLNGSETINVVHVGVRYRKVTSGTLVFNVRVKASASGTVESSSNISSATTSFRTNTETDPKTYPLTLYDLPGASTTPWTKADLDTAQIGVSTVSNTANNWRLTAIWMVVDYAPALVSTISDTFDDNLIDSTKWNSYTASSGAVAETGQQMQTTLAASTNGSWAGIHSVHQFDLTGSSIFMQIVSATTGNSWLDLTLSNEPLPTVDNFIAIGINVGTQRLEAVKEVAGSDTTLADIAYDPAVHKWVRLRESGGTVYWDWATDPNGTWTNLYSTTPPVPITNVYVVCDDYEYDGASTPNAHKFDNLNVSLTSLVLRPNANGTTMNWTAEGGDYTRVNETSSDGDTSRLYTPTDNVVGLFNFDDHTSESGTISSITLFVVIRGLDPVSQGDQLGVQMAGTEYWGSTQTWNSTSYTTLSQSWTTNPNTSAAWTWTDIDNLQAGVKRISGGGQAMTQVYVIVYYTADIPPAASALGPKFMFFFD